MDKLNEMIDVATGFKYSVNLRYDINNKNKLKNYIPTDRTMEIMNDILQGLIKIEANRSHILFGSYGTGKSNLAMVLASLLSQTQMIIYDELIDKVRIHNQRLADNITDIISNKYLIVLPEDGVSDFEQSVILGLRTSLEQEGLEDILPDTFYDSIIEKIELWKDEFPSTYQQLQDILQENYNLSIVEFKQRIKEYDREYYEIFIELHPKLTAGSQFDPYNRLKLTEILTDIDNELKEFGYNGIMIIFDEFGKFLEENIGDFNIKSVQDLAEYCNTEDENINTSLLLITHKNLAQYTAKESKAMTEEWRKVEGRFKRHNITQHSSQIYELISKVILKDETIWEEFKSQHINQFKKLMVYLKDSNLFTDLEIEQIKDWILFGCYPLHPATAFGLFNLSKLVAQNERSLFTFLSHKKQYSLVDFLQQNSKDEFPLIGLDQLYDYFCPLFKQEENNSRIYGVWKDAHSSLQKLSEEEELSKKFIKALAVIYIIADFNKLPPAPELIKNNLNLNSKEFDEVEMNLLNKKVIFYRKSINQYKFFDGSDLDIEAKIKEATKVRSDYFNPVGKLNSDYLLAPLLPHRYNLNYKVLRFFTVEYLTLQQLTEEKVTDTIRNEHLDGKVFIILPSNKEEIMKIRNKVKKISNPQAIFIIPKSIVKWQKVIKEIDAIEYLLSQEELLEEDPIIELELEFHLEEREELLIDKLNKFYHPAYDNAYFYNQGQEFNLQSNRDLSQLASEICEQVFSSTMIINHEMINRNQISGIMKRVRKDIIKKILINSTLKEELGFSNFTAAHTVARSILVKNNILQENEDEVQIVVPETKENGKEVAREIKNFLDQAQENRVSFSKIYNKLQSPPYGLRKGHLPILLAAYMREFKNRIVITQQSKDRELSSAIFDEIEENPNEFKLGIDLWNDEKENYIISLEKIFSEWIDCDTQSRNRLKALWEGMKKYYRNLPHYTRNTELLSSETMTLKKLLERKFENSHYLFFDFFLKAYQVDDFKKILERVKFAVEELNQALTKLYSNLSKELSTINKLNNEGNNVVQKFIIWYNNLSDRIKNHHFNWQVNSLFDLINEFELKENKEQEFLNELAERLTGFTLPYWNDEHFDKLLTELEEIFVEIENYEQHSDQQGEVILSFSDEDSRQEITFDREEISELGEMLLSKLEADFNNFGHSISNKEKITILFEMLQKHLQEGD